MEAAMFGTLPVNISKKSFIFIVVRAFFGMNSCRIGSFHAGRQVAE